MMEHLRSVVALAELLANPGFEDVQDGRPVGWLLDGVGAVDSATDQVMAGAYSVRIGDPRSDAGIGLVSSPVPVTSEDFYRASVYTFPVEGQAHLYLEFRTADGKRINPPSISSSKRIGSWKPLVVEAVAPPEAVTATIRLYLHHSNVGSAYFDDASLQMLPVRTFDLAEPGHPRLYFTAGDVPALRSRLQDERPTPLGLSWKQIWNGVDGENPSLGLRDLAEVYLTETSFEVTYFDGKVDYPLPPEQPLPPQPPRKPGYPYWTEMARQIQLRIEVLALVGVLSEDGQPFAERAKGYVLALADWEHWHDPDHDGITSLDTAHLTISACTVSDMLYGTFTPQECAKLHAAVKTLGADTLYHDWGSLADHNIALLKASALGIAGAFLLDSSTPDAHRYLTRATEYFALFLDRRTAGQQEGLHYTGYATDHLLLAADQIERTTGDATVADIVHHHFLDDLQVRWVVNSLARNAGLASFSDSTVRPFSLPTMCLLNSKLGNGQAGWYLGNAGVPTVYGNLYGKVSVPGFLYSSPDAPVTQPAKPPSSAVLEEIGWALLRSGWDVNDVLLAFASNDSRMGHNHYDQNSFQIATNGIWVAADPGYLHVANDFVAKLGHNTIQVNREGQSDKGGGRLTQGLLSPVYDYVKGSAADAYQNPKLDRFDRHIVYIKPYYFVIFDDLAAADPALPLDWILYSGQVLVPQPGRPAYRYLSYDVDGQPIMPNESKPGRTLAVHVSASSDGKEEHKTEAQLRVTFVATDVVPITIERENGAEDAYALYARVASGIGGERTLTVLQAAPASTELPDLTTNRLESDNAVGVAVHQANKPELHELVLFSTSGHGINLAKVQCDAAQAYVSGNLNGAVNAYAMTDGTSLSYLGRTLLASDAVCSAALEYTPNGKTAHATVSTQTARQTTMRLLCPRPAAVEVDNTPLPGHAYSYDQTTGLLTLHLPAGTHAIHIR